MPIITDECLMCGACADECPVGAISEDEYQYVIDQSVCVKCEGYADSPQCVDVGPNGAILAD